MLKSQRQYELYMYIFFFLKWDSASMRQMVNTCDVTTYFCTGQCVAENIHISHSCKPESQIPTNITQIGALLLLFLDVEDTDAF